MIGVVRDTWRAVLVVVVAVLLREVFAERPAPASPTVATPTVQTPVFIMPPQSPPDRPLRRVAQAFTELGDSVIGVIRR